MRSDHCVEVATFTLKKGIRDEQLLAVEARIRGGTIASQPGFIGRELCKDETNGEWLMIMRFDDRAHMEAWLTIVKTVPEMRELGALIESFTSNRFVSHRV